MSLEPDGGNLYRAHLLQIDSGTFWRCAHGTTGFGDRMAWKGCAECARADPAAFAKWHGSALHAKPEVPPVPDVAEAPRPDEPKRSTGWVGPTLQGEGPVERER